jgi:hypothetical protein
MHFDSRFAPASWRRPALTLLALGSLTLLDGCESDRHRSEVSGRAAMFSQLIHERGGLTYLSRTYSTPGIPSDSKVTGLVIMRQPADLRPIGGDYYDDGFGNLIGFGSFSAPKFGGRSSYALTFRKNGGMQLAIDFRDDLVVDVLLELDKDGRLGALADPDTQWMLDCIAQQIAGGANMAAAANLCLKSVGGGGGGLGRGAELEADRLSEPDCSKRGGPPGSVTEGGGGDGTVVINLDNGTIYAESTTNSDGTSTLTITVTDTQGRVVYTERTTFDNRGRETSSEVQRTTYNDRDGSTRVESERREGGRVVESSDVTVGPRMEPFPPRGVIVGITIGRARIIPPRGGGTGPTRQPGPECEDCPVEDPRCAPAPNDIASLWDCQAETDMSLLECLKHMQDLIYTATGGRCAVEPGADDRPNIKCADKRLMECLQAGGNVEECLRSAGYHGDSESIGPENDDFFRGRYGDRRGQVAAYIDSTPMAGVFVFLCPVDQCPGIGEILAR